MLDCQGLAPHKLIILTKHYNAICHGSVLCWSLNPRTQSGPHEYLLLRLASRGLKVRYANVAFIT